MTQSGVFRRRDQGSLCDPTVGVVSSEQPEEAHPQGLRQEERALQGHLLPAQEHIWPDSHLPPRSTGLPLCSRSSQCLCPGRAWL